MSASRNDAACVPAGDHEEGQAAISVVLILGLFLLGIIGFAVDLTNIWFHRQAARAAADAACQAGAMDLLAGTAGVTLTGSGFVAGVASDCVGNSGATMCTYAALNGYNGSGLVNNAASNSVSWTFPNGITGVTGSGAFPFLRVLISENVRTYFMSLVKATKYQNVNLATTCGVVQVKAAAPMVVLNPVLPGSFLYSGGGELDISGGPQRGLQVNSTSPTAVTWIPSGVINTSLGGPLETGSDVAVVGGPTSAPASGWTGGVSGSWKSGVLPVVDPFASVAPPLSVLLTLPTLGLTGTWVGYGVDGCPDHVNRAGQFNSYCREFSPGYYPLGIIFPNNYSTIIFRPGVYYLSGGLIASGSNTLRVAKPPGYAQTDGVMFYFLLGSPNFSGCTGCDNASNNIDNVSTTDLTCDGSPPDVGLGMPASIGGNVLYAQCTKNGTYWDAGGDTTDAVGTPGTRGLLIFQDHLDVTSPVFSGSGQLSFSGALYFHALLYSDVLVMNGGASSGSYMLGQIVTDTVQLTGSGKIKLALNPSATASMSKVAILQ